MTMNKATSKKSELFNAISNLEKSFEISYEPYDQSFINEILMRYLLLPKETEGLIKRLEILEENLAYKSESFQESGNHFAEIEREIAQKNQQLIQCQLTIDELQNKVDELTSSHELLLKGKIDIIKRMVATRDQQLLRLDMAKKDNLEAFIPIFNSLCKESLKLLEHMGMTEMPQFGSFDATRHIVVETRPASDSALHDTIAEVFRPGYYFQDEVFRPQEVIIYSYKAENEK